MDRCGGSCEPTPHRTQSMEVMEHNLLHMLPRMFATGDVAPESRHAAASSDCAAAATYSRGTLSALVTGLLRAGGTAERARPHPMAARAPWVPSAPQMPFRAPLAHRARTPTWKAPSRAHLAPWAAMVASVERPQTATAPVPTPQGMFTVCADCCTQRIVDTTPAGCCRTL